VDVVLNCLWGESTETLRAAAAKAAPEAAPILFVQVGSVRAAIISLPAATLRSIEFLGSGFDQRPAAALVQSHRGNACRRYARRVRGPHQSGAARASRRALVRCRQHYLHRSSRLGLRRLDRVIAFDGCMMTRVNSFPSIKERSRSKGVKELPPRRVTDSGRDRVSGQFRTWDTQPQNAGGAIIFGAVTLQQ
jgi:hypothetical protein